MLWAFISPLLVGGIVGYLMVKTDIFTPTPIIITNPSDTSCTNQLGIALETLKVNNGYAFVVEPGDVDSLARWGAIALSYSRDGQHIRCNFKIVKTDKGCRLKHYKRSFKRPGHYNSESANYGSVDLPDCLCEKEK